jgi:hypothetical protein
MSNILVVENESLGEGRRATALPADTFWVGFGGSTIVCGRLPGAAEAARVALAPRAAGRAVEDSIDPDELFLVSQKGRLFQREHPEARVVLDKGRFLVVHLPPEEQARIGTPDEPCYTISPLPRNEFVFERPARAAARAPVPAVQAFVDRVAQEHFRADVERLTTFQTRHSFSTLYREAATLARNRFEELGFAARHEEVQVGAQTTVNTIADRAGTGTGSRALVLIIAHLDSINLNGSAASRAPGADDNASGSAGVLEIARVLRDYRGRNDLRLVLCGGEEQGLHGSKKFVAQLAAAERARIGAVVNMDMIARRNTADLTSLIEGAPVSRALIDSAVASASTYTELEVQTSLHPHDSDHVPFIDAGIPAILTIEGTDSANDDVHTENDAFATLDFGLMKQILRMNVAVCAGHLEVE